MFHVKHGEALLRPDFWRAGASAKAMCKSDGVACAILRAKAIFVKSFLRVWCKLI
jgi:hypothetical protein